MKTPLHVHGIFCLYGSGRCRCLMRVMVVGGVVRPPSQDGHADELCVCQAQAARIGQVLALAGHDIAVCSPFDGSADVAVMEGVSGADSGSRDISVELHCPDTPRVLL